MVVHIDRMRKYEGNVTAAQENWRQTVLDSPAEASRTSSATAEQPPNNINTPSAAGDCEQPSRLREPVAYGPECEASRTSSETVEQPPNNRTVQPQTAESHDATAAASASDITTRERSQRQRRPPARLICEKVAAFDCDSDSSISPRSIHEFFSEGTVATSFDLRMPRCEVCAVTCKRNFELSRHLLSKHRLL